MSIVREEHSNNIVREIRHFRDLTKEEYGKIVKQRVDMFVVWNKRIMNPIDVNDINAHYIMIWEGTKLLGCCRVCLPYSQAFATKDIVYNYPVWDKCTIIDPRISMFPTKESERNYEVGDSKVYMWAPEWGLTITGTKNGQMDMYADGHAIVSQYAKEETDLHFIGEYKDKWGYDGYRWVYEPENRLESQLILNDWLHEYLTKESFAEQKPYGL